MLSLYTSNKLFFIISISLICCLRLLLPRYFRFGRSSLSLQEHNATSVHQHKHYSEKQIFEYIKESYSQINLQQDGKVCISYTDFFSFYLPQCFGSEQPTQQQCCEVDLSFSNETTDQYLQGCSKVILAGALSSGTKYIANYLQTKNYTSLVPRCTPQQQQQQTSLHNDIFQPNSISSYQQFLAASMTHLNCSTTQQILVDDSPDILTSPYAACRVSSHWPSSKFVIILRDPVDRAISEYVQQYVSVAGSDSIQLFSQLVTLEIGGLKKEGCTFQWDDSPLRKSWSDCLTCATALSQTPDESCLTYSESSVNKHVNSSESKLVRGGMYVPQIANFLRFIHPKDMLVLPYTSLVGNPIEQMQRIHDFLSIQEPVSVGKLLKQSRDEQDIQALLKQQGTGGQSRAILLDIERMRQQLAVFYYQLNQELYSLLKRLGYKHFPQFKSDEIVKESTMVYEDVFSSNLS